MTPSQPVDFKNTEVAFRLKTDSELNNAKRIFRLMNSPLLVRVGTSATQFALKTGLPVEGTIKNTVFKQFCGGETIDECQKVIQALARYRVGTILDYALEEVKSEEAFDATQREILKTIDLAATNRNIPFCVFKMSGIARFGLLEKLAAKAPLTAEESVEWNRAKARFERICHGAYARNVRVFVDAEQGWIQEPIDELTLKAMAQFNRGRVTVYQTLQLYRTDALKMLKRLIEQSKKQEFYLGLKLVRGAYLDQERQRAESAGVESPVFATKEEVDRAYSEALKICVEHIDHLAICAGTHNEASTTELVDLMRKHHLPSSDSRIFFAQLYGMSDNLTFNLAHAGFNAAKYVPYGPVRATIPYLIRRAQENTSVLGQTSRELAMIKEESRRRKRPAPSFSRLVHKTT